MRLLFRTYPTHHQKIMVTTTNFIFPETLEISSSAIQKMVVGDLYHDCNHRNFFCTNQNLDPTNENFEISTSICSTFNRSVLTTTIF